MLGVTLAPPVRSPSSEAAWRSLFPPELLLTGSEPPPEVPLSVPRTPEIMVGVRSTNSSFLDSDDSVDQNKAPMIGMFCR